MTNNKYSYICTYNMTMDLIHIHTNNCELSDGCGPQENAPNCFSPRGLKSQM